MFSYFAKKGQVAKDSSVPAPVKRTQRRCVPDVAKLEDRALLSVAATQYTPFVMQLYSSVLKTVPTQQNVIFWDNALARGMSPARLVSVFENAGVNAGTFVRAPGTTVNSNSNGVNVNFPGGSVNVNNRAAFGSVLGTGAGVSRNGANVHIPFASVNANRRAIFGGALGTGAGVSRNGTFVNFPGGFVNSRNGHTVISWPGGSLRI